MPQIAPLPSGLKIGKRFRVSPVTQEMRGRTPLWLWVFAGATVLVSITALIGAITWSSIFDSVLASQLALIPNSRSFKNWESPPVPLYFNIYFFNWTNADQFPEKPVLEQLGPYSFREKRRHVNVTFNDNNGTISYKTFRSWYFDEEKSNGSLDDRITTLNAIAASAVYTGRHWGFIRQKGLSMGLSMFHQKIFISKTANELFFEGFEDPLLDMAKGLPSSTTGGAPHIDRFGWFYGRNNSFDTDGYMEVTSGKKRGTLPGQVLKWNYQDHLPYYKGECSKISGSAGEFLPRNLNEGSALAMFIPDLCRTVNLDYVESGDLEGLQYNKFAIGLRSFDTSPMSSDNTCFCNGPCGWSGVMNVSACRYGSPAFISLPHFLYADEPRALVDGLNPDPANHEFYIAMEPKLGVPLEVSARFQLNMFIESHVNVDLYKNVPKMLFPILWVEQKVRIEENIMSELRYVRAVSDWGAVVCACAALFFAVLVAIVTCWARKPQYSKSEFLASFEKPEDEVELKLNPI